ncbi:MAG: DUF350 domain-containing protein [Gammaproteobacteria bacterium]|nr:DUF350 domain-containing protein [Gammaproteobacteria bacterium]
METLIADLHLDQILSSLVYSFIGIFMFFIALVVIDKLTPYSIHKEIEEDQNIALGIIIGATLIGLAIIISAAIQ